MYEKLVSYASQQLEINADDITPDTTFASLGIDSLDTVEMLINLEDKIGKEIELDQKVETVGDLVRFIESKME